MCRFALRTLTGMGPTQFGPYKLLRKLAAGGMAEIFLAEQSGPAGFVREVVVKRLYSHMADDKRILGLFQFEAKLLSALCHPNIPQVYELGEVEGQWYMTMEYVQGLSVSELWQLGAKVGHAMPLPVAVGIVSQAAEALHYAHERRDRGERALRLVHRDINPHNLMVTPDGIVKVLDFGIAQSTARPDTNAGTLRGTLAYMAPEQVRGKPLDKRADVFALGVVLYELTTGTRLYRGPDVQIMTKIVEEDAPPPSMRVPNYPHGARAARRGQQPPDRTACRRAVRAIALERDVFRAHERGADDAHGSGRGRRGAARRVRRRRPGRRGRCDAVVG
jgi:serine/threonine protein kinase